MACDGRVRSDGRDALNALIALELKDVASCTCNARSQCSTCRPVRWPTRGTRRPPTPQPRDRLTRPGPREEDGGIMRRTASTCRAAGARKRRRVVRRASATAGGSMAGWAAHLASSLQLLTPTTPTPVKCVHDSCDL